MTMESFDVFVRHLFTYIRGKRQIHVVNRKLQSKIMIKALCLHVALHEDIEGEGEEEENKDEEDEGEEEDGG